MITPQWPAPKNIQAYSTLRYPGHSLGVYTGCNLALHVGDNATHVLANRQQIISQAQLPAEPKWLNQTHSATAILAETISEFNTPPDADACYTQKTNTVCIIMTADCLPILITNKQGTEIAAVHAGWRGLANGIIESTLTALSSNPEDLLIWIGPSISQPHYEVGEDFYHAFTYQQAFQPIQNNKWLADVPLLAKQRLIQLGVHSDDIYLSNECTYAHPAHYFSYRRDNITGRMASFIYMNE